MVQPTMYEIQMLFLIAENTTWMCYIFFTKYGCLYRSYPEPLALRQVVVIVCCIYITLKNVQLSLLKQYLSHFHLRSAQYGIRQSFCS